MKSFNLTVFFFFAISVFGGCASTNVISRQEYLGEKIARPGRIIIYDFAATSGDVPAESTFAGRYAAHSKPQTAEQINTGRELGTQVAKELTVNIRNMGLPAVRAAGQEVLQPGDLAIRGYFVSIDEGNAEDRMLVGFGSGTAELRTVVEGYQMTRHGLRLLGSGQLEAGGNKKPGVLVGLASLAATGNPVGLIVGGVSKLAEEESGSDTIAGIAKRTAKEIADILRVKFEEQGWI